MFLFGAPGAAGGRGGGRAAGGSGSRIAQAGRGTHAGHAAPRRLRVPAVYGESRVRHLQQQRCGAHPRDHEEVAFPHVERWDPTG